MKRYVCNGCNDLVDSDKVIKLYDYGDGRYYTKAYCEHCYNNKVKTYK